MLLKSPQWSTCWSNLSVFPLDSNCFLSSIQWRLGIFQGSPREHSESCLKTVSLTCEPQRNAKLWAAATCDSGGRPPSLCAQVRAWMFSRQPQETSVWLLNCRHFQMDFAVGLMIQENALTWKLARWQQKSSKHNLAFGLSQHLVSMD